jgi:hypothetical protein
MESIRRFQQKRAGARDLGEVNMQFKSLGVKGRRAILASTVAFSWIVTNPLLPNLEGVAFAKGNHGQHDHSVSGQHGAHHGKTGAHHNHRGGKNKSNQTTTTTTDDDTSDDDSTEDDSTDDDGGTDDGSTGTDDNGTDDDTGGVDD